MLDIIIMDGIYKVCSWNRHGGRTLVEEVVVEVRAVCSWIDAVPDLVVCGVDQGQDGAEGGGSGIEVLRGDGSLEGCQDAVAGVVALGRVAREGVDELREVGVLCLVEGEVFLDLLDVLLLALSELGGGQSVPLEKLLSPAGVVLLWGLVESFVGGGRGKAVEKGLSGRVVSTFLCWWGGQRLLFLEQLRVGIYRKIWKAVGGRVGS